METIIIYMSIWYALGIISLIVATKVAKEELYVKDLPIFLLCSLAGPVATIISIRLFLLESEKAKKILNKRIL